MATKPQSGGSAMTKTSDELFDQLRQADSLYLGPLLRRLREERGLSLDEFAQQVGRKPEELNRIETGQQRSKPTLQTLRLFANTLSTAEGPALRNDLGPPPSPNPTSTPWWWDRTTQIALALIAIIVPTLAAIGLKYVPPNGPPTTPSPTSVMPAADLISASVSASGYIYHEILTRYPAVPSPEIPELKTWPGFLVSVNVRVKGRGPLWRVTWLMKDAVTDHVIPTQFAVYGSGERVPAAPIPEIWATSSPPTDWDSGIIEEWIPYPPCNRTVKVRLQLVDEHGVAGDEIMVLDHAGGSDTLVVDWAPLTPPLSTDDCDRELQPSPGSTNVALQPASAIAAVRRE